MLKKIIFTNSFLLFSSVIVILILLELTLRLSGFQPWNSFKIDVDEPTINKYDPKIGWIPNEGIYNIPPKSQDAQSTTFTILKDGSRFSGKTLKKTNNNIIVIGGSFAQGWMVNDQETFASLLQKKLVNSKIKNFGVGGYGTYQSYLLLKEILKKNNNIKHIIYIFINHHEVRNVGDASWLELLTKYSKRSHLDLPYVQMDKNGNLIEYKAIRYIKLPFREHSVLVTKIEKKIMRLKLFSKYKDKTQIAQKLILKMKNLSNDNKSNFDSYVKFSEKHDITSVNCAYDLTDDLVVKNDNHPNPLLHKLYAECIYEHAFN
jgi:hypothetical protein